MTTRLGLKLCVTIAALALVPAAARAAHAPSRTLAVGSSDPALGAPVGAWDYSGLLSLEIPPSGFSVGPRLTGEMMYGFMDLAPQARLKLGGRASFAYHSGDFDTSIWMLEAVPDAKIEFAVAPRVALYADLGLGLAIMRFSGPSFVTPFGTASASDTTLALAFQVGGGASFALDPHMNLLTEVRLDVYTRSGSSTFVSVPTIGLQFH